MAVELSIATDKVLSAGELRPAVERTLRALAAPIPAPAVAVEAAGEGFRLRCGEGEVVVDAIVLSPAELAGLVEPDDPPEDGAPRHVYLRAARTPDAYVLMVAAAAAIAEQAGARIIDEAGLLDLGRFVTPSAALAHLTAGTVGAATWAARVSELLARTRLAPTS